MIYINRKKRDAFYADERIKRDNDLAVALELARAGAILDDDQLMLVDDERYRIEELQRKKEEGWGIEKFFLGGGLKTFLMAGLDKGDGKRMEFFQPPNLDGEAKPEGDVIQAGGEVRTEGKEEDGIRPLETKAPEANAAVGGPLDEMAEKAVESAKSAGGWGSWWGGK